MKRKILHMIFLFSVPIISLSIFGCASIERTTYFGDIETSGPIISPPTHVNIDKQPGEITISPKISLISMQSIKGTTNDRLDKTINLPDGNTYSASEENLLWNFSDYTLSADLDYKFSHLFSIFGGMNISGQRNSQTYTGGYLGLGIHNYEGPFSIRFDLGLNIQNYDYIAVTVIYTRTNTVFGSDESMEVYKDKGKSTNINPFFTLIVNTNEKNKLMNFFGELGFFSQSILNLDPGESNFNSFSILYSSVAFDKKAIYTAYFIYLTPGINLNLSPNVKLVLATKVIKYLNVGPKSIIMLPSIQMDFQI